MQLERIMRFSWGHIRFVHLNWRAGESTVGVATLALQARSRTDCRGNDIRFSVGFEVSFNVWLLLRVRDMHCISCGFGGLKGVRHGQRGVLALSRDFQRAIYALRVAAN